MVAVLGGGAPAEAARTVGRTLRLRNIHTNESLELAYWARGRYLDKALVAYDHLLRDHHLHRVCRMDPRLYDLLWILQTALKPTQSIEVLSGYRSAMTNRLLDYASDGVAQNSYHIQGKAVDIRVPGTRPDVVAAAAEAVTFGGVGRYGTFVHIDVGPVRHWST
ncbi:MAG: DUF882 domain-containing protein [Alphaproteobacteria bacterium]